VFRARVGLLIILEATLTGEIKSHANSSSEQEVIHGAKQGDSACFELLYHQHKRRVYAFCLRMTRDTVEAEDLTQDVFLQMYCNIATFRGDATLATWLYRIAVNRVLMRRRRKSLPITPKPLELLTTEGNDKGHDNLDRIALERSVGRLAPGYRAVFLLHDVEGYEHHEIAKMMGCSVGNSKSQLHKARLRLRSQLQIERRAESREPTSDIRAVAA
jgi:RNA polymerase sigma-70 factor (ECF subfamily)